MTDLISREAAISELTLRRSLLDAQNVVTDVSRDLSIYDICIDVLRALPAPEPTRRNISHTAAAADMLAEWDTWVSGQGGDKATAARLGRASMYAYAASLYSDGIATAPFYTMRAFLQAIVDIDHGDLEYLREDGGAAILAQMMQAAVAQVGQEAPTAQ